jgi:hypothetical protein
VDDDPRAVAERPRGRDEPVGLPAEHSRHVGELLLALLVCWKAHARAELAAIEVTARRESDHPRGI